MCELCGYVYDDCLCEEVDVRQQQMRRRFDEMDAEVRARQNYQRLEREAWQLDHYIKTHEQLRND